MLIMMGLCTMLLPCAAILYKWKNLVYAYVPFAWIILLGGVNESISVILIHVFHKGSNAINNNIYVLLESIGILWFFRRSGCFSYYKQPMLLLTLMVGLFWFTENILQQHITGISPFFRLFYSFITVSLSLYLLNYTVERNHKKDISYPDMLITLGFIVFFSYKFLVEACWIYGAHSSSTFQLGVYNLMSYVDWFCNILYTIAILWIPQKNTYSIVS